MQLDQVLTSLQSDSREDLKALLDGLVDVAELQADARREDATRRRWRSGQTAAESFNDALDDIPVAERSTAQVLEALLGTEPDRDVAAADPRHGATRPTSSTATRTSSRT